MGRGRGRRKRVGRGTGIEGIVVLGIEQSLRRYFGGYGGGIRARQEGVRGIE